MRRPFRTNLIYVTLVTILIGCGSPANQEAAIRNVLEEQSGSVEQCHLEAFMETYVKSKDLRFSSGGTIRKGWENTKRQYYESYPSKEDMGRAEFVDLTVKSLSSRWGEFHGSYHLY